MNWHVSLVISNIGIRNELMRVHCLELKCNTGVFTTYGMYLQTEAGRYLND